MGYSLCSGKLILANGFITLSSQAVYIQCTQIRLLHTRLMSKLLNFFHFVHVYKWSFRAPEHHKSWKIAWIPYMYVYILDGDYQRW